MVRSILWRALPIAFSAALLAAGVGAASSAAAQSMNTRTHTPPGADAKQHKLIGKARTAGKQEGQTLLPQINRVPCGASIGGAPPPGTSATSRVRSQTNRAPDTIITGDVVVDCGTGPGR